MTWSSKEDDAKTFPLASSADAYRIEHKLRTARVKELP